MKEKIKKFLEAVFSWKGMIGFNAVFAIVGLLLMILEQNPAYVLLFVIHTMWALMFGLVHFYDKKNKGLIALWEKALPLIDECIEENERYRKLYGDLPPEEETKEEKKEEQA